MQGILGRSFQWVAGDITYSSNLAQPNPVLTHQCNVRAACTATHLLQIIRGSFTPLPTTRSKELRELVTSMLQLDASRRPSANQLLAMPVLRARIQNFLTRSLQVRVMMALGCAYCGCRVSHTQTCTYKVVSNMHTQTCTYLVTTDNDDISTQPLQQLPIQWKCAVFSQRWVHCTCSTTSSVTPLSTVAPPRGSCWWPRPRRQQ